jgi:hypothetical protein
VPPRPDAPILSFLTPSHSAACIGSAWESIRSQTIRGWEWIIVANGGLTAQVCTQIVGADSRVHIVQADAPFEGRIGALKRQAASVARGEYMVEFDHDDELSHDCGQVLLDTFLTRKCDFAYSRYAAVAENRVVKWAEHDGWRYESSVFGGKTNEIWDCCVQPLPLPQNIARIWYAPNHVRAWRSSAYRDAGGHDPSLAICDDQDLMCRLYIKTGANFAGLEACLYKYRMHRSNSWRKPEINSAIIPTAMRLYDRYIERMALAFWGKTHRCMEFSLRGESDTPFDRIVTGLQNVGLLDGAWPIHDSDVGVIKADTVLQFIESMDHFFAEAHRCLAHGGLLLIDVPSVEGGGGFCDERILTHWSRHSFWRYGMAWNNKTAWQWRFQIVRLTNYYPTPWHKDNNIVFCRAHLAAIKAGPELHGPHHTIQAPPTQWDSGEEIYI